MEQIQKPKTKEEKIRYYEEQAANIKHNITGRKRPLIVEFSGLPKSGKTTVVNSLSLFLRRNGIPNIVITERASICPIKNKEHVDFNIWTGCTSLVNMINYKQKDEFYVIIIDRGIFDTLVWLNLLNKRGKLNDVDFKKLTDFFLLDKWRSKIDLVICMETSVEKAIEREFKDLLTYRTGSIMNRDFLIEFLGVLKESVEKFRPEFNKIIPIDTTETNTLEGVEKVVSEVLTSLEYLSNEELITVPLEIFRNDLNFEGFQPNKFKIISDFIRKNKVVERRKLAESNSNLLQIVVCAILTYKNKIAVFTKKEISDKRLHDKKMIWVGGHFQNYDFSDEPELTVQTSMIKCLERELEEELEIDNTSQLKPQYKGLVYDNTHYRSIQHLGVVFQIEIKEGMLNSLDKKSFRELSGQANEIEFVDLNQNYFKDNEISMEPWSVDILNKLFNVKVKLNEESFQRSLF